MQVPAPFEYARATSIDSAIELLAQLGPEARLLAGGHSLLPMMKLRLASPEYLIDIDPLADELGYVTDGDHEVRIGAMTRHLTGVGVRTPETAPRNDQDPESCPESDLT